MQLIFLQIIIENANGSNVLFWQVFATLRGPKKVPGGPTTCPTIFFGKFPKTSPKILGIKAPELPKKLAEMETFLAFFLQNRHI
jgi:hypothetical protein